MAALFGVASVAVALQHQRDAKPDTVILPTPSASEAAVGDVRALCGPWLVRPAHDGVTEVIDGARRLAFSDRGEVSVATSNAHANIVLALPSADGWLFVDRAGFVERSDHFLGRLQPVGSFPSCFREFIPAPRDTLAAIDDQGRLWMTDARNPPRIAPVPGRILRAAFLEGPVGAAVLWDGRLAQTRDGGRTWVMVDLGLEVARHVYATTQGIVVTTTSGERLVGREGEVDRTLPARRVGPPRVECSNELREIVRRVPDRGQRVQRVASHTRAEFCTPPGLRAWRHRFEPTGSRVYACAPLSPRPPTASPREQLSLERLLPLGTENGTTAWGRVPSDNQNGATQQVEWRGVDSSGLFYEFTRPGQWFSAPERRGGLRLIASSRQGVLIYWRESPVPPLYWGTTGGDFRPVPAQFTSDGAGEQAPEHSSVVLPDGGVVVSMGHSTDANGTAGSVFIVGPDGLLRGRRGYLSAGDVRPLAALWGDVPGVVVADVRDRGALRFLSVDGTVERALRALDWTQMPACSDGAVSGAVVHFRPVSADVLRFGTESGWTDAVDVMDAEVEISPESACVRAWTVQSREGASGNHEPMRLVAAPGDRFVGPTECRLRPDSDAIAAARMHPEMSLGRGSERYRIDVRRCTDGDFAY